MRKAPLVVELGATCVQPGAAQTITIRTDPGLQFSWGTRYADGNTHREYAGEGVGVIPASGIFTAGWTIPPAAPVGAARTDVAVIGKVNGTDEAAFAHPAWQIAKDC